MDCFWQRQNIGRFGIYSSADTLWKISNQFKNLWSEIFWVRCISSSMPSSDSVCINDCGVCASGAWVRSDLLFQKALLKECCRRWLINKTNWLYWNFLNQKVSQNRKSRAWVFADIYQNVWVTITLVTTYVLEIKEKQIIFSKNVHFAMGLTQFS